MEKIKSVTTKTAIERFYYDSGEKALRKAYAEQRALAQKRLDRLRASKFGNTQFVQNYDDFPKLKDINTSRDLIFQMSELNHFVNSPRSTIKGQTAIQKKRMETLQQRGYDVNADNIEDFDYMIERARDMGLFGHYDSDQIIDSVWSDNEKTDKGNINKALKEYRKKHKGALSKAKEKRRKEAARRAKRKK